MASFSLFISCLTGAMTAVLKPGEAHASSDLEELRRNLRQLEEAHDNARKEFDDTKLEYAGIGMLQGMLQQQN
jgi:hypothetical protein